MEKNFILKVENLSKTYKISKNEVFHALKNLNFKIEKGKSLGIVGRNGSGKSTLLKVLSGITSPTHGRLSYRGKLLSILDIGSGFHPELTGMENISLYSSFLGEKKNHALINTSEIIEFSELGDFINLPIKKYSSGMYLRLAFSIVLFSDVDILVLDEVISVGDQAFMTKCYERIEFKKKQGISIILVSHNLSEIYKYTDNTIWLDKGEIIKTGTSNQIISEYQMKLYEDFFEHKKTPAKDLSLYNNRYIQFKKLNLYQESNSDNSTLDYKKEIIIECDYTQHIGAEEYSDIVYVISNVQMQPVYLISSILSFTKAKNTSGKHVKSKVIIPSHILNVGYYNLSVRIMKNEITELIYIAEAFTFKIVTHDEALMAQLISSSSSICPTLDWDINSIN